jgi:hypothetical protein
LRFFLGRLFSRRIAAAIQEIAQQAGGGVIAFSVAVSLCR